MSIVYGLLNFHLAPIVTIVAQMLFGFPFNTYGYHCGVDALQRGMYWLTTYASCALIVGFVNYEEGGDIG